MGKFLKWENANNRKFVIDTSEDTIACPDRTIYASDILGAIMEVDGEECIVVSSADSTTTIVGTLIIDGTVSTLTYTKATGAFTLGETSLTKIPVDMFGRVPETDGD